MNKERNTMLLALLGVTLLAGVTGSCEKNVFSKEEYQELVQGIYPVDTVDVNHDWNLLKSIEVTVMADAATGTDSIVRIELLTANPYKSKNAEIAARRNTSPGGKVTLRADIPNTQTQLWAAAVTRNERYYVKAFPVESSLVSFSSGTVESQGGLNPTQPQTFTYLFENTFPVPDDFDYNDIVLRMSMTATSATTLRLKVDAVGTLYQTAAAVRLVGVPYNMVEEVAVEEDMPFDNRYPMMHTMLEEDKVWFEANNGEAVVYLFEDAHWTMRRELDATGGIKRRYYNTEITKGDTETSATTDARTRNYIIKLREGFNASTLRLADMDPFIIEGYNGGNYEVHTFPYKLSEVVWNYLGGTKDAFDDYFAWGLLVPSSDFRYTLEGASLGTFRNGVNSGVYSIYGHSFGEWARDHEHATDWWEHPNYGYY